MAYVISSIMLILLIIWGFEENYIVTDYLCQHGYSDWDDCPDCGH